MIKGAGLKRLVGVNHAELDTEMKNRLDFFNSCGKRHVFDFEFG